VKIVSLIRGKEDMEKWERELNWKSWFENPPLRRDNLRTDGTDFVLNIFVFRTLIRAL
jgi:hypothetical protein